jgi:polysaccharide biosynthesis protein PelG
MAGIGLRLHKVVAEGSYVHAGTAYLSSALISAGPWLTAVLALSLLGSTAVAFLGQADRALLLVTITYAFSISLVLTGGPQLVVTRYLADRLYLNDTAALAPTCAGVLLSAIALLIVTLPFVVLAPFDLGYRLLAASLFLTLSLNWLVIVFLSATRDYRRVVLVFVGSYALSVGAAVGLGHLYGLPGSLAGFTLGQVVCLVLLVAHVYLEFPSPYSATFSFLSYGRLYWDLGLIGLLYSAGMWVDNVIYWFSPSGTVIAHFYRTFPSYDSAKLVAYFFTIPAAAFFLVHLETTFYHHYKDFYRRIAEKGTLKEVSLAKQGMAAAAWSGLRTMVKLQGLVALAALLVAPRLATVLHLPPSWVPLFRVAVPAASGQFLMLSAILLLLYLDERRAALLVTVVFAASNTALTGVTVWVGHTAYGGGYLLAALMAALLALSLLHDRLQRLEYRTFMLQPVEMH